MDGDLLSGGRISGGSFAGMLGMAATGITRSSHTDHFFNSGKKSVAQILEKRQGQICLEPNQPFASGFFLVREVFSN